MNLIKKIKYLLLIVVLSSIVFILPVKGQEGNEIAPVILTWSTDTYTPIEYQGKALPALNSKIEVAATINIDDAEFEKLFYTWTLSRNHHLQKKITEKGKQTFSFNTGNSIYHIYSVELEIQNEQKDTIGKSATLSIKSVEPQIILQPDQEVILSSNSSDLKFKKYQTLSNQTIKFTATPYFFNIYNINELSYDWIFGQEKASQTDNMENPNIFKLKIDEVAKIFSQDIQLTVKNNSNVLQNATVRAQLTFIP